MYKIAICDDDKNYREKIEKVIETEGILPTIGQRYWCSAPDTLNRLQTASILGSRSGIL